MALSTIVLRVTVLHAEGPLVCKQSVSTAWLLIVSISEPAPPAVVDLQKVLLPLFESSTMGEQNRVSERSKEFLRMSSVVF